MINYMPGIMLSTGEMKWTRPRPRQFYKEKILLQMFVTYYMYKVQEVSQAAMPKKITEVLHRSEQQ